MKNKESIIEKDLSKVVSCGVEIIDSLFDLNDNKGFEPGYTMIMSEKKYNKELITCDIANSLGDNVFYCDLTGFIKDEIKKKYTDMHMIQLVDLEQLQKILLSIAEVCTSKKEKTCLIININNLIKIEELKIGANKEHFSHTGIIAKIYNFLRKNFKLLYDNDIFVFLLSNIETKTSLDISDSAAIKLLKSNESLQCIFTAPYFANTIFRLDDGTLTLIKSQYSSLKNKVCKML